MNYYKNVEISRKYNVSVDTVANWITGSLDGKNQLELYQKNNRAFILKTASNMALLEQFSSRSRKFRNKKYLKNIYPTKEFFRMYNEDQIMDLITILETYRELDMKFIYFDDGAKYWDDLYNRSLLSQGFSIPRSTEEVLNISKEILFLLMRKFKKVDIVDLGLGNGKHIITILKQLFEANIINQYIGLDYSKDMLGIAQKNISDSLPKSFTANYYLHDLTYDSINKYLFKKSEESIGKFVFFIGSTIENIRDFNFALRLLKNSLKEDDILILGNTLKNENGKQLLNFSHNTPMPQEHREAFFIVLDRLGINEDCYEVIKHYDKTNNTRYVKAKLKYDLEIVFNTNSINRIVKLSRHDLITIYRHKHHSIQELNDLLNATGFKVLHSITSSDYGCVITICTSSKYKQ